MNTFSPKFFDSTVMQGIALANTEALANWMALWNETWIRAATVRNPLEYATIGSLMLPACASQAMLYCKRISDITAGGHEAASVPLTDQETGQPAAAQAQSVNASSSAAATDSPDLTHAQTPSTKGAVKRSASVPRFRGE